MSPKNFAYWLQGFFEISGEENELRPEQIQMIKRHLDLVFTNVTSKPNPIDTKFTGSGDGLYC